MASEAKCSMKTTSSSVMKRQTPSTNSTTNDHSSSTSYSTTISKKTKRWPLHVEAIVHPYSSIAFQMLEIEIEKFVTSVGQTTFMYKEGKMDLSTASETIQKSCIEIAIVDLPLLSSSSSSSIAVKQENGDVVNKDRNIDDIKNETNQHSQSNLENTQSQTFTNKCNRVQSHSSIATWSVSKIIIHCYVLSTVPSEPEEIDEMNDEPITVCEVLPLPHKSLHTSWESLIYPREIKENIIGYAESSLLFSNKGVCNHLISWNRVLLLHGPPGTGKTSLCRALAHKLTIRTNSIFPSGGYLLEVKSHSLFSKWFSESGKLIAKLFERIREMVEDEPKALFCVLIDEVESLASSRIGGGNGGGAAEPSDAVRAVNSVLTSLDSIRNFQNVLILTTTNITQSIDSAFVDRVDLKQYIGHPCMEARYEILRSCLLELIKVGIVSDSSNSHLSKSFSDAVEESYAEAGGNDSITPQNLLFACAEAAEGLSGRSLRKLPFQTHAFFVRSSDITSIDEFLISLKNAIIMEKSSRGVI